MKKAHGRHTTAFVLLLLCRGEAYGAQVLSLLQTELPFCFSDSADVYRCLSELEQSGCAEARWELPEAGQPRKWYGITPKGRKLLADCAEDIRKRRENFDYFLENYGQLRQAEGPAQK